MGGQLSCVSCKNRKETNSSTTKTNKKVESKPAELNITSNAKYCPVTSGWELYQILQTSNGWVRKCTGPLISSIDHMVEIWIYSKTDDIPEAEFVLKQITEPESENFKGQTVVGHWKWTNPKVCSKGEEKLSDVEKVARAIVEINVYLASQVIYPALERYIRETQNTPEEDKDEEDNEEEKKEESKQRFSNLPHNETKSSS